MNGASRDDGYDRLMREFAVNAGRKGDSSKEDDEDYGPLVSRDNRPRFSLHIKDGAKPVEAFFNCYVKVRAVCWPERFEIKFGDDTETYKLTVEGTNLESLFDQVCEHRVKWIRTADRGFDPKDGKPFITRVRVETVEREG